MAMSYVCIRQILLWRNYHNICKEKKETHRIICIQTEAMFNKIASVSYMTVFEIRETLNWPRSCFWTGPVRCGFEMSSLNRILRNNRTLRFSSNVLYSFRYRCPSVLIQKILLSLISKGNIFQKVKYAFKFIIESVNQGQF